MADFNLANFEGIDFDFEGLRRAKIVSSSQPPSLDESRKKFLLSRRGIFTASEVWKLMGEGKSKDAIFSQTALYYILEKRTELLLCEDSYLETDELNTPATRWGKSKEMDAIKVYQNHLPNMKIRVDYTGVDQITLPKVGFKFAGTPDGLIGKHGMIEVKCPYNSNNHTENLRLTVEAFKKKRSEYFYQIQALLWVTGRKWCIWISFDPRFYEMKMKMLLIERDETVIAKIAERVRLAEALL
jgi:YqaJ-like viral recombinase domain